MQRRSLLLLSGAAAIALGAALLIEKPTTAPPAPELGALAFPGLAARLANAARIEVRRHDGALDVVRQGDSWVLPSKHDYPIKQEKLRELLTGLTELRLMEPRTGNPEMLDRLGLEDPMRAGATSTLLRVVDAQGAALAELVIGRRRVRTQGNVPESAYVRRPNENQAWLAEGRIPVDADPQLWLERDIANLPRERVRRVSIARAGEAPLVLTHSGDPDGKLGITTPTDAPAADDVSLDEVSRSFEFLTFLDVRRAADAPGEALGESRFEMTDRLSIIAQPRKQGDEIWVMLTAEGDEEAARLNARWRGWIYQVGQWKEKAMIPWLEDLRRQEEAPPAAPEAPAEGETPSPAIPR